VTLNPLAKGSIVVLVMLAAACSQKGHPLADAGAVVETDAKDLRPADVNSFEGGDDGPAGHQHLDAPTDASVDAPSLDAPSVDVAVDAPAPEPDAFVVDAGVPEALACNPVTSEGCAERSNCAVFCDGGVQCVPSTPGAGQGAPCSATSRDDSMCDRGFACVGTTVDGGAAGFCLRFCFHGQNDCPDGTVCDFFGQTSSCDRSQVIVGNTSVGYCRPRPSPPP